MTTFDEARAIVAAALAGDYPPEAGLEISASGLENDTHYQLFTDVAMSKYITPEDGPAHVVEKATGVYSKVSGFRYVIPAAQECGEPDLDDGD